MTSTAAPTSGTGTTTWTIDAAHSNVEFAVKHLMISTVRGHFPDVKGTVVVDEANPANSRAELEIAAASVDTRQPQRDAHLRSADFFDTERYPTITFRSRRVEGDTTGDFTVIGDLTIHGVTREVPVQVTFEGRNRDPWGGERIAFTAKAKVDRKDFGLVYNQALETGGFLVGDDIKLTIETELVKA